MRSGSLIKIALGLMICIGLSSCYKVKKTFIMKGEWVVNSVRINGGATNFMEVLLPEFDSDTCEYRIYFGEGGVCSGQYYVGDSLRYAVLGDWVLLDDTHLWVEIDQYVKGSFEIEEQSASQTYMYAEKNIVKLYNIGETQMFIDAGRR